MNQQATPGVQRKRKSIPVLKSGFDRMGHPIPFYAKQEAYKHCVSMGLDKEMAHRAVEAVSDKLERDDPFGAQCVGMQFLDCTGMYRLMAVLLATQESI